MGQNGPRIAPSVETVDLEGFSPEQNVRENLAITSAPLHYGDELSASDKKKMHTLKKKLDGLEQ